MILRVASTSDHHAPLTSKKLWAKALKELADFQPDVYVMNGDWFEGKFGSRHSPDRRHRWTLVEEFESVVKQARDLNEAIPKAKKVWLYGNHDDNLLNYTADHVSDEDVVELVKHYRESVLSDALEGWHVIDQYTHSTNYYIGGLAFRHGFDVSHAGIVKDVVDYGYQNCLMCFGHTHRPQAVTQHVHGQIRYPYWFCNTGTLANRDEMHYMDRMRRTQWGAGLLLAETSCKGIHEGKALLAKPGWKAEMKILEMESQHFHDVNLRTG